MNTGTLNYINFLKEQLPFKVIPVACHKCETLNWFADVYDFRVVCKGCQTPLYLTRKGVVK